MTTDSPITVISDKQIRLLLTALLAKDGVQSRPEIILHDNAQAYLGLEAWLDLAGVEGPLRDRLLGIHAGGGLSRAMANDDLYLRLQMIARKDEEGGGFFVAGETPP